jgi:hypothetical protein
MRAPADSQASPGATLAFAHEKRRISKEKWAKEGG